MAQMAHGGGEEKEHHRKERKPHSDYVYRSKQKNLEPFERYHTIKHERLETRKRNLEGGYHRPTKPSGERYTLADFVEYQGDRLGLIHIGALIPHRRKKYARKRS